MNPAQVIALRTLRLALDYANNTDLLAALTPYPNGKSIVEGFTDLIATANATQRGLTEAHPVSHTVNSSLLKEFMADVEAVMSSPDGEEQLRLDWPDLYTTYKKAQATLALVENKPDEG